MRSLARWLVLALALAACGPRPAEPPPPPPVTASPIAPSPAAPALPAGQASLEEPGLKVTLDFTEGLLAVDRGQGPVPWRLAPQAVAPVAQRFLESPLFGPEAKPTEEGKVTVALERDGVRHVRSAAEPAGDLAALAEALRGLVPRPDAHGPDFAWVGGTLVHEDLEGGTWKIVYGKEHFVIPPPPADLKAGAVVGVTGRPAEGGGVGISMAGPYYEVMSIHPLGDK